MPKPKAEPLVSVAVELSQNDFLRGSFWFLLFRRRILLLSLCLPLPAVYVMAREHGFANFSSIAVLLLIFVVFWGAIYVSIQRQFANIPLEKRNYQFRFFADYVLLKTGAGETKLLWQAFHRLAESENYIYLFVNPRLFHVIPKRCLASPDDLKWLQQSARGKILAAANSGSKP